MRRAFVVVLDACGIGALPDADDYGDAGTNTLVHLAGAVGGLQLPALESLGLGCIQPIAGVTAVDRPALHGRLHALGPGKDSTAGHWELMGVVAEAPMPTYPEGFPDEVIGLITAAAGRGVICNRPYNGIAAIDDFGAEHLRTGALIVYTSQDSVLQIAAHERLVSAALLQEICGYVRRELPAEDNVGRVIARPFKGEPGHFERTDARKDFATEPPAMSYLDELQEAGVPVHSVGKAGQLFVGRGVDEQHPGATNAVALEQTGKLMRTLDHGLVFTNLIETDQVYGHRHDMPGFVGALERIDAHVAVWLELLRPGDLLVLTADHGVDLTANHTDHTREHVPLLAVWDGVEPRRHDGPMSDVGASVLRWLTGADSAGLPGTPFL
ncbi:MAG TPA: phosphopentomutase [Solirubrobacteraceae bacterium]|nr:phosphopentomutase [Solirubrobacteraceae bacterium]